MAPSPTTLEGFAANLRQQGGTHIFDLAIVSCARWKNLQHTTTAEQAAREAHEQKEPKP